MQSSRPSGGPVERIPLLILGGGTRKAVELPPTGRGSHPLTGCKGVDLRIDGRCIVDIIIERFASSGAFGPFYVAGPADAYRAAGTSAVLIDSDAGVGRNLKVGIEAVRRRHPGEPMAISTCDILPDAEELGRLLEHYNGHAPSDLWFPVIRAPADPAELGASAWKPQYSVIARGEKRPAQILPGHLTIFDPDALRLDFLYRLMDLAYESRNRPILVRRAYILRKLLLTFLEQDLRHILQLRLPTFTWDVVRHGTVAARKLKDGIITQDELEAAIRSMCVRRRHRKRHPERSIQIPVMSALSLAWDIDTQEEAAAIGASTRCLETEGATG